MGDHAFCVTQRRGSASKDAVATGMSKPNLGARKTWQAQRFGVPLHVYVGPYACCTLLARPSQPAARRLVTQSIWGSSELPREAIR